ncbi:hypothetical protein LINGRAHAP2_LOCUS8442 [Linum grandiflorum]
MTPFTIVRLPKQTYQNHARLQGLLSFLRTYVRFIPSFHQVKELRMRGKELRKGGALRSESWRSSIDNLLINIVENCCRGRQGNDGRSFLSNEHAPMHPDFQLAALKALLASLLSPSRSRPPHLAQSLELFRRDSLSVNSLPGFKDSASQRPSTQFPLSNDEAEDGGHFSLNDDMLYQSWIDNSKGTEGSIEIVERQTNIEEETDAAARVETDAEAGNAKADTMIGNDEIMVDLVQANATVPQVNEIVSAGVDKVDVARESYDNAAEITGSDAATEHQSEDLHPNKFAILGSPKKRTVTGAESDTDSS